MGNGASKSERAVRQDVEYEGDVVVDESIILNPQQFRVSENVVVSSKKMHLSMDNVLQFEIEGAGVFRIGILSNDPSGRDDCTQEAVYEIEIGVGAGASKRVLFVDNGGYFCFGENTERKRYKEYKYVQNKEFYVYVLCIFGEPTITAFHNGSQLGWNQTISESSNISFNDGGQTVQFGIARNKAIIVWRKAIKTQGTYCLEWNMLLEKHTISGKNPKFGFFRIGFVNKPNPNGVSFGDPGSSSAMWFTESAIKAYPYSNTVAFRIERQGQKMTISHNILVESIDNIATVGLDFNCDQDMYLAVEMCSGDIRLAESQTSVRQPLGRTFFVDNFTGGDDDDYDDIIYKISEKSGHDPCRLQFGCTDKKFVVEFRKRVREQALQNMGGNVTPIEEVKMVQIVGEAGDTLETFDIEQEFSRNYEVVNVTEARELVWIVEFEDIKDARSVWMESEWVIGKTKVTLLPYYEQLGVSMAKGKKPTRILETKSIDKLDKDKLKFIKENTNARQDFTDYLQKNASITVLWTRSMENDKIVVDYAGFDESWYEPARSTVIKFIEEFTVPTGSDEYSRTNAAGEKIFKEDIFDKIVYMEKKGMLANTMNVYKSSRFSTNKTKREAKLIGPAEEIKEAYNKIHEIALQITIVDMHTSKPLAVILRAVSAQNMLFESLRGIQREDVEIVEDRFRVWLVRGGASGNRVQNVHDMFGRSIENLFVDQRVLPVQPNAYPSLETTEWETLRNELMKNELVHIEVDNIKCLKITTTCELFETVKKRVDDFLADNTTGNDVLFIGRDVALYLSQYTYRGKDNMDFPIDKTTGNCTGFVKVQGTDTDRSVIKKDIEKSKQDIKIVWFQISKPWLASAIAEFADKSFEDENKCIMEVEIADSLSKEMVPCVALPHNNGWSLFVMQTDITEANCDVIVNNTNTTLQTDHGLSKCLCAAAGRNVVNECKDRIKTSRELSLGEVYVGMPGNLQCCKIFHVASSKSNDNKADLNILKRVVSNVLRAAELNQYSSIIIPALGCGGTGTTKDCTLAIVEAVSQYMTQNTASSITEVYLSDKNEEKINGFIEAVEKVVPKQFVFKHGRPLPALGGSNNRTTVSRFGKTLAKTTRLSQQLRGERLRFHPDNMQHGQTVPTDDSVTSNGASQSNNRNPFASGLPYRMEITDTLTLHVEANSIESQNVDVIVNPTAHFPEMGNAVSRALIRAGGNHIVNECKNKGDKDFKAGNVVRTSGGKLQCKHIYHVKIEMTWHRHTGIRAIYNTVSACLKEADRYQCRSISFPSIGTGASQFPPDKVANGMINAVCDFTRDHPNSSIKNVHIVIYFADAAVLKIFEQHVPLILEPTGLLDNIQPGKIVGKNSSARPKLKYSNPGNHTDADDVVVIKIITAGNGKQLIKDFEKQVNDDYDQRTVTYKQELVTLSESEEILIKTLGNGKFMSLEIDKQKSEVKISGLRKYIQPVEASVREMITLKIPELRQKHEMGERIAATIEWHFENNDGKSSPVSAPNNYEIQMNYLGGKDFEYKNTLDGKMYKVLVNSLEEHPADQPGAKRRRLYQKVKLPTDGIALPEFWTILQSGGDIDRVTLSPNDADFQEVKKSFIQAGCPVKQILNIIRLEDRYKWLQYQSKKKQIEKQNPSHIQNERQLWHGTDADTVEKIIRGGYDRSFRGKNATYYGLGVYFAKTSSYSDRYAVKDANGVGRMFYNKVLTGEYCQGVSDMGTLPKKVAKGGFNILFDSAVDTMSNPGMYVIFHDTQAYPEYLIEYK